MILLISYCSKCGSAGELHLLREGAKIPEYVFEQECVFCDSKLVYVRALILETSQVNIEKANRVQSYAEGASISYKPTDKQEILNLINGEKTGISGDFWEPIDLAAEAQRQGVKPVKDINDLVGGWPEDESFEDFMMAINGEGSEVE